MPTLKDFRRQYSAELLIRADQHTAPGALYDWVGLTHRRLDPRGLNIAHELLPTPEAQDTVMSLLRVPPINTQFAQLDLTREVRAEANIDLPNVLNELKATVNARKIQSFVFEDVVSRAMPPEIRLRLRALLEVERAKGSAKYRRNIRPYMVVDNLFYASKVVITLQSDTQLSAAATLAVENAPGGTVSGQGSAHVVIRYNQQDCPFAAELTKGKDL